MLIKVLLTIIFWAPFDFRLARRLNDKSIEPIHRNGEPCDWFIDLLQKRRINRESKEVPQLLSDVTEEPKEYDKYNFSAPYDFAGDHLTDTQMIGCDLKTTTSQKPINSAPCDVPSSTASPAPNISSTPCPRPLSTTPKPVTANQLCALTSTSTSTTSPTTSTTTEAPCEETRMIPVEYDSLLPEAMIKQRLAQRLSLPDSRRTWKRKYARKSPLRKRRVKRSRRAFRKKIKKCKTKKCDNYGGDCVKKKKPAKERILFEANVHVGEGFQELLLDMLSPGDKTIKIAEEEENNNPPQMHWEISQDGRK